MTFKTLIKFSVFLKGSEEVTKQPQATTDPYRMISSGQAKWHRYQMKIWEVLDEPYSSKLAKVYFIY